MAGPVDMPLIISQLANVQKISNSEVTKAQLQQSLMINPAEQEKNKEAQKQVQQIEKEEGSQAVQDESNNAKQHTSSRKRKKKEPDAEEEKENKPSPWSGNIVNLKI